MPVGRRADSDRCPRGVCYLLIRHLAARIFTTEDGVLLHLLRGTLVRVGIAPEQVRLRRNLGRSVPDDEQLDLLLCGHDGFPRAAIEFKYYREIPGAGRALRTQRAPGGLLPDCRRVLAWPERLWHRCLPCSSERPSWEVVWVRHWPPSSSRPRGNTSTSTHPSFRGWHDICSQHMGIWPGNATLHGMADAAVDRDRHVSIFTAHAGTRAPVTSAGVGPAAQARDRLAGGSGGR